MHNKQYLCTDSSNGLMTLNPVALLTFFFNRGIVKSIGVSFCSLANPFSKKSKNEMRSVLSPNREGTVSSTWVLGYEPGVLESLVVSSLQLRTA
ncbi:UNVERIFIED_CONTAM: hypothetical protein NCL1_53696 [Trichonephila clavipes]